MDPFSLAAAGVSGLASVVSGKMASDAVRAQNNSNREIQEDFAKNGLQWKMEDARKAGISPWAALGAPGLSASPSFVGDNSYANMATNLGQDVGRAIDATRSPDDKLSARLADLQVTHGELENMLLRSQIAKLNAAPSPGIPAGQAVPSTDYAINSDGSYSPVMSEDMARRSGMIGEALWYARHLSGVDDAGYPPDELLPKGATHWERSLTGHFVPSYSVPTGWSMPNPYYQPSFSDVFNR